MMNEKNTTANSPSTNNLMHSNKIQYGNIHCHQSNSAANEISPAIRRSKNSRRFVNYQRNYHNRGCCNTLKAINIKNDRSYEILSVTAFENHFNFWKELKKCNENNSQMNYANTGRPSFDLRDPRYDILTFDQVQCLKNVLQYTITIKSDVHVEIIQFSLMKFILAIKDRLIQKNISVYDIRLNGGAASHVLSLCYSVYNDIDLIFDVDLKNNEQFELVREAFFEIILEFSGTKSYEEKRRLIDKVVTKMVKIDEIDRWSLFAIQNNRGCNVEIKFVDSIRRQYEFSVDSFQIILDTLLQFLIINPSSNSMTFDFYPTVIGESMYGNFHEAMFHLNHHWIVTKNPEEIRGGGLLKYCSLLVHNFHVLDEQNFMQFEPSMSKRFFSDFHHRESRLDRLLNYLKTHFSGDSMLKYNFIIVLYNIIRRSSFSTLKHTVAIHDLEMITKFCYLTLLFEYFEHYQHDTDKMNDFFQRCQKMCECHCPETLLSCIHRYLHLVYKVATPIMITFVNDKIDPNTSKENRKINLNKFMEYHDAIFPISSGFSFALLPTILFKGDKSNHYIISASTLNEISTKISFENNESSEEFRNSFLIGKTNKIVDKILQLLTHKRSLTVSNLLPTSFFSIDYAEKNVINPQLLFNFSTPIAPPPSFRLCIVNRIPIDYHESIESGPMFKSQLVNMFMRSNGLHQPKLNQATMKVNHQSNKQVNFHYHPHPWRHPFYHFNNYHLQNLNTVPEGISIKVGSKYKKIENFTQGFSNGWIEYTHYCVTLPISSKVEPLRIILPSALNPVNIVQPSSIPIIDDCDHLANNSKNQKVSRFNHQTNLKTISP